MPVLCDAKGWAQYFLCARQVLYQWSCISTLMKLIFFSHSQWVTLEDFWKSCSQFYLLTMNGLLVFIECLEWPCYFTTEPFKWCPFFSPHTTCELCWACFAGGLSTCSNMPVVMKKSGPSDLYRVSISWLLLCFTDIKTELEVRVPWAPPITYSKGE